MRVIILSISICILAKNEEKILPKCLKDIKNKSYEIIVIDNGSTDNTKKVAEENGCIVYECNDKELDQCRNLYLEKAKNKWVLIIDADEYISHKSVERIIEIVKKDTHSTVYALPRFDYIGRGQWAYTHLWRLLNKDKGIKYNNSKIHGTVYNSVKRNEGEVNFLYAPIHHYDFLYKKRAEKKRKKYRELLKDEINSSGRTIGFYFAFLGLEYYLAGNVTQAIKEFYNAIEYDKEDAFFAYYCLGRLYLLQKKFKLVEKSIKKLLSSKEPYYIEKAMLLRAQVFVDEKNIKGAIESCTEALKINPTSSHIYINLATLYLNKQPNLSIEYLKRAINLNPNLTNKLIYKDTNVINTFSLQNVFLSETKNIFSCFRIAYKKMGYNMESEYWENKYRELFF